MLQPLKENESENHNQESWLLGQTLPPMAQYQTNVEAKGCMVVWWLECSPHSKTALVQIPTESFLCGLSMFSPWMGFLQTLRISLTVQKHASKVQVVIENEKWFSVDLPG